MGNLLAAALVASAVAEGHKCPKEGERKRVTYANPDNTDWCGLLVATMITLGIIFSLYATIIVQNQSMRENDKYEFVISWAGFGFFLPITWPWRFAAFIGNFMA